MSGALAAGSQLFSIGSQALGATGLLPAFIRAPRSLGTIIPDVTIEEHHTDRMEITVHPVAQGTPISDHAYRQPCQVVMRLGWTNSNPVGSAVSGLMSGGLLGGAEGLASSFTESRAKDIYQQLLNLQTGTQSGSPNAPPNPQPFQLTTGKRNYPAMMIAELTVTTDRHSEYALMLEARLQEVIIVSTQITNTPGAADQADQSKPQTTAGTTDQGTKQTNQPYVSSLSRLTGSRVTAPP
jgi:hypothetical protein